METKLNYTMVGLFVVVFTALFFIIAIWLSVGLQNNHYNKYSVYMKESVSGLSEKAPVKYNGVEVGYVGLISLSKKDPSKVMLLLYIVEGTPISVETRAELNSQGLTGIGFIELTGGKPDAEKLKAKKGQKYPVIPSEPSLFFRLDQVIDRLSQNVDSVTDGLKQILSKQNAEALQEILANTRDITEVINKNADNLNSIINNTSVTMKNVAAVSEEFPQLVLELKESAQTFNSLADEIKKTSAEARSTFANTSAMTENMNNQLLPEFIQALSTIQKLVENLDGFSEELKETPSMLIRGRMPAKPGPGERK